MESSSLSTTSTASTAFCRPSYSARHPPSSSGGSLANEGAGTHRPRPRPHPLCSPISPIPLRPRRAVSPSAFLLSAWSLPDSCSRSSSSEGGSRQQDIDDKVQRSSGPAVKHWPAALATSMPDPAVNERPAPPPAPGPSAAPPPSSNTTASSSPHLTSSDNSDDSDYRPHQTAARFSSGPSSSSASAAPYASYPYLASGPYPGPSRPSYPVTGSLPSGSLSSPNHYYTLPSDNDAFAYNIEGKVGLGLMSWSGQASQGLGAGTASGSGSGPVPGTGLPDQPEQHVSLAGPPWSLQEDDALRHVMATSPGRSWPEISKRAFPSGQRGKQECLERWKELSKPKATKGPWTAEEDEMLLDLVEQCGPEKWVIIASRMSTRTGKQCRERWHNHLNPSIKKSPFTSQEDELIFDLYSQWGSKWAEIAKYLPGRPDNMIKNHFNTSIQRQKRRHRVKQFQLATARPGDEPFPSPKPGPSSFGGSHDLSYESSTATTSASYRYSPYARLRSGPQSPGTPMSPAQGAPPMTPSSSNTSGISVFGSGPEGRHSSFSSASASPGAFSRYPVRGYTQDATDPQQQGRLTPPATPEITRTSGDPTGADVDGMGYVQYASHPSYPSSPLQPRGMGVHVDSAPASMQFSRPGVQYASAMAHSASMQSTSSTPAGAGGERSPHPMSSVSMQFSPSLDSPLPCVSPRTLPLPASPSTPYHSVYQQPYAPADSAIGPAENANQPRLPPMPAPLPSSRYYQQNDSMYRSPSSHSPHNPWAIPPSHAHPPGSVRSIRGLSASAGSPLAVSSSLMHSTSSAPGPSYPSDFCALPKVVVPYQRAYTTARSASHTYGFALPGSGGPSPMSTTATQGDISSSASPTRMQGPPASATFAPSSFQTYPSSPTFHHPPPSAPPTVHTFSAAHAPSSLAPLSSSPRIGLMHSSSPGASSVRSRASSLVAPPELHEHTLTDLESEQEQEHEHMMLEDVGQEKRSSQGSTATVTVQARAYEDAASEQWRTRSPYDEMLHRQEYLQTMPADVPQLAGARQEIELSQHDASRDDSEDESDELES